MPNIDLVISKAEEMQFNDNTFDTVLMTYTLCTVEDVHASLSEIKRVLKPEGQLLFCEHGLAPEEKTAEWQNRINYIWPHISGGCNLNKDIPHLIERQDSIFQIWNKCTYLRPQKILSYNYWGTAIKAD